MPLTPALNSKRFARRLTAARFFAALLLFLIAGLYAAPSDAQRRRQRAPRPAAQSGANANTPAASAKTEKAKRVFVGRSSDTDKGSRQTIKSDNALNDYSAYRSGDRFFVVLPKADANSIPTNDSGRGFSDMKVQQRGNDVVLSYRVRPGAKPRVEQKFNRLDVVFDSADGNASASPERAAQQQQQTPQTATANDTRAQGNSGQPAAQQNAQSTAAQNATSANERRAAAANAERANQVSVVVPSEVGQLPGTATQTQLPASLPPAVVADATPTTPSDAPADADQQQLAQAQQQPATTAPITTTNAPETQLGTSLGSIVLRNWPLALTLALLLVGIGLFWAARRSSTAGRAPLEAGEPKAPTPVALKGASQVKLKDASTGGAVASTSGAMLSSATPSLEKKSALATSTLAAAASKEEETAAEKIELKEQPEASGLASGEDATSDASIPGAGVAGATTAAAILAGAALTGESARTKEITPAAASADAEEAQQEARRLLDGEAYNRNTLAGADVMTRQMIAAELLAALAGRNPERRERARKAFIEHGYFNETTHDLHFAAAPAERSAAARSLGLVGDRVATSHLVAALEDPTVEVRRAVVESLATLRDPKAVEPLESLLEREKHSKNKVARKLVVRAIETCRGGVEEETPTLVASTASSEVSEAVPATDFASTVETPRAEELAPATKSELTRSAVEAKGFEESAIDEQAATETVVGDAGVKEIALADTDADTKELAVADATELSLAEDAAIVAEELPEQTLAREEAHAIADDATLVTEADSPTLEQASVEEEIQHAATPSLVEPEPSFAETLLSPATQAGRDAEFEPLEMFAPSFDVAESELAEVEGGATAPSVEEAESSSRLAPEEEASAIEATAPTLEVEPANLAEETLTTPVAAEVEEPFVLETTAHEIAPERGLAEVKPASVLEQHEASAIEAVPDSPAEEKGIELVQSFKEIELVPGGSEGQDEDWVELDMSEMGITPSPTFIERYAPPVETPEEEEETLAGAVADIEEPVAVEAPQSSGEKGIEAFGEFSTVPKAIQQRLSSDEASERVTAITELSHLDSGDAFHQICAGFDDEAKEVRSASARALYELNADRADSFTRALREADPERRRNIGTAIAASGLASEAIGQLTGESRDKTYEAFSLLFLMAKAGEVAPLIRAIEGHPDNEVRLAVVKLLALSGQKEILPAFRRLAVRGSLPTEVRSAVMEAIYQISSAQADASPTA